MPLSFRFVWRRKEVARACVGVCEGCACVRKHTSGAWRRKGAVKRVRLLERKSPQKEERAAEKQTNVTLALCSNRPLLHALQTSTDESGYCSCNVGWAHAKQSNHTCVYCVQYAHMNTPAHATETCTEGTRAEKRKGGIRQKKRHEPCTERQSTERTGAQAHTRTREGRQTRQQQHKTKENTGKKSSDETISDRRHRSSPIADMRHPVKNTAEQKSNVDRLMGSSAMLAYHFPRCLPLTTPSTQPLQLTLTDAHNGHRLHRKGVHPRSLQGRWLIRCGAIVG